MVPCPQPITRRRRPMSRPRLAVIVVSALLPALAGVAAGAASPGRIRLPPGFSIGVFADRTPDARSLALGPDGVVFVGTRKAGKVYAVVDTDGDGRGDRVFPVARGLTMPNGVAFRDGALYVAEVNRILRFDGIADRLSDPPRPVVVFDGYPKDRHHGWKFIRFGPDGQLYVPVGAPCNVCETKDTIYATITRLRKNFSGFDVVARGVRNSVGFDWHPETGELWFTDNGRDWLGDDLPPDELNRLKHAGRHFGFPYCYGKQGRDPLFGAGKNCNGFEPAVVELNAHVAPLGMRFYSGAMFPARYRGRIFIAEHGSWNRSRPVGYRIVTVDPDARDIGASHEVFAEGWLEAGRVRGRPVDLVVMPDGALLVSDDKTGRIYRITYEAAPATPGADTATPAGPGPPRFAPR